MEIGVGDCKGSCFSPLPAFLIRLTPRQARLKLCVNAEGDYGYGRLTFELLWNHAGVVFKQIAWRTKGELC